VTAVFAGLLATVLIGAFGLHGFEDASEASRGRRAPTAWIVACAAVIALAFFAELQSIAAAARTQVPFPPYFARLPIVPLDDRGPYFGHAPIAPTLARCTLVQTVALGAIAYLTRGAKLSRAAAFAVAAASALMLALAFATPAATSFDMYAYAGSAHVAAPYHPAAVPFGGDLAVINDIYGVPISPSPYGPVMLALVKLAAGPLPTLALQLFALRALGLLALLAALGALRSLRFPAAALALVALNPGLILQYVLDAHNDIVAIALALWAVALLPRSRAAAVALAILAGGVKLPFLIVGALAFAALPSTRARLQSAAATLAGGVALYAILGGGAFLGALATTSRLYRAALLDPLTNALHAAVAVAAVTVVALALARRTFVPTGAWSFAALGATFFAWYVPWGLPYAALERRWFAPFLVAYPALSFVFSTTYAASPAQAIPLAAVIALGPVAAYVALRGISLTRTPAPVPPAA